MTAQGLKNFSYLKSCGPIPTDLLISANERFRQAVIKLPVDDSRETTRRKKDFYLKSNYALKELLESGRVVFGDPVSEYVSKVAQEVLKTLPDLKDQIHVYVLKSSSVNAYSLGDGYIFVNVGLISKLNSEAELAFILCHEISHYKDEHAIHSYLENIDLQKGKGEYSEMDFEDRIDLMFKNSRETELNADSAGLMIFLKTGYDTAAISSSLDILHFAYMPYENIPFEKDFFNDEGFVIPADFFLDSVKAVSIIKDYKDDNQTHPNILKRKQQMNKMLAHLPGSQGRTFQVSEASFLESKEICRFEQVRLDLIRKRFGDALYNSWILLQKYPENPFLDISIAKALYGLSSYRNVEEFQKVAKSYVQVEGESQQVHSLVRRLSKKQLNALALRYICRMMIKYPGNQMLGLMHKDLVRDLVIKNNVCLQDIMAFAASGKPYTGSDFWYALFTSDERRDPTLQILFDQASRYADSLKRIGSMTAKEIEKLKGTKKQTYGRPLSSLVMVDPSVDYIPMEKESDYQSSMELERVLMIAVNQFLAAEHRPVRLLKTSSFTIDQTDNYNMTSLYKELMMETTEADKKINLHPLGYPESLIPETKGLISQVTVLKHPTRNQLFVVIFDLEKMERIYQGFTSLNFGYTETTIQKILKQNIQL